MLRRIGMVETLAKELRKLMSAGEGPGVEDGLYNFACQAPSQRTIIQSDSWTSVLSAFHKENVDDQFVPPLVRVSKEGKPLGLVKDNDVFVYFDFRTDRAKPLTSAFLGIPFEGQVGGLSEQASRHTPKLHSFVTMTHYDDNFTKSPLLKEAFNPSEPLKETYAEVIGREGIDQLVCAESEKWRAVTWFKDGRRNLGYKGASDGSSKESGSSSSSSGSSSNSETDKSEKTEETSSSAEERKNNIIIERHPTLPITVKIVPSRKVAAHIQAPQMRAKEICDLLMDGVNQNTKDIFANFANADMVGHAMTDEKNLDGVVDAIVCLDEQLGKLVPLALKNQYVVFITADHGNAEEMLDKKGKANPAHTSNQVPFIVLGLDNKGIQLRKQITIADLAPSALHLRGMNKPQAWTRKSVFEGEGCQSWEDEKNNNKDRKVMRLILDGYGVRQEEKGNAMQLAAKRLGRPLHMDRWMNGEDGALSAHADASGESCGYPKGESGTTEFGHVLFDAGRDVRSDVLLINHALQTGKFAQNEALLEAAKYCHANKATLHVAGVLSDGGVHSSLNHLEALMQLFHQAGLKGDQVSLHPITDGRDVPGDSSPRFVEWLENLIKELGVGQINSFWGRGWGKDRDNRWKRIEAAYRSLTEGTAGVHVVLEDSASKL